MAYRNQKHWSVETDHVDEAAASSHLMHFNTPNRLTPIHMQKKQTKESSPKMDFQGREDRVRVLPHDPPMPTRPKVPLKPPIGQTSRPSVGGDKDPAHPTKPAVAPKPDMKKCQPASPINTDKPVSSKFTPSSGEEETEESPFKMDFQGRKDRVQVLLHDPPMPTSRPPKVPLKPPTGQTSRPSVGGDKDPAHPTKPAVAPKPDKKKYQPAAAINTEEPLSSKFTPSSGDTTPEKISEKDKLHSPGAQRVSRTVEEEENAYEVPINALHPDPQHCLPGGLADPPSGTVDKRKAKMYLDKLLEIASDPEGSILRSALEGMVLERKTSKTADPNFALYDPPWRSVDWSAYKDIRDNLRMRQISSPEVKCLRILVHGPVGAGKSSFVNSVASIFQERIAYRAAVDAISGHSFTKTLKTHYIQDCKLGCTLPFAICDIMGLENEDFAGLHIDDLIKVLQGHIKDGYKFKPRPCSKRDSLYLNKPSLNERIHCLVSVIPADIISFMEDGVIDKMRKVRSEALDLNIPQMVVLTKVDLICPAVDEDLKLIYRSKMIKKKMQECSNRLGVPMNCIFPVKNYHEESDLIDEVNVLVLSALKHILNCADDHVINMMHSLAQTNKKK